MKVCRFDDGRLGLIQKDEVVDVTGVLDALPARRWPFPIHDEMIANFSPFVRRSRPRQRRGKGIRWRA